MPVSTLVIYVFLAAVAGLTGVAAYLAWRGRVFLPRATGTRETRALDDLTRTYLTAMSGILGTYDASSPSLGSARFDEGAYRDILARLDEAEPSPQNEYHSQHSAYRDAVALYAERRRQTAHYLRNIGSRITQASGYNVVDCVSAGKARDLMLTYRGSVDRPLQELLDHCEQERDSYYAMLERHDRWRYAVHMLISDQ